MKTLSFISKGRGLFQVSDCDNVTPSLRNCLEYTCLNQVGSFIVKSYLVSNEIQGIFYVLGVNMHDTSGRIRNNPIVSGDRCGIMKV